MTSPIQDAILLLGDSLTQFAWEEGGFAAKLADIYGRKLDVVNRGLSGYNTKWALQVFDQCCQANATQNVQLLTIWYGANDAAISPSVQHIPLEEYKANLKSLVAMARSTACTAHAKILLINPPPVSEKQCVDAGHLDRKAETTREYARVVGEVVRDINDGLKDEERLGESVELVDVWTAVWKAAGETEEGLRPLLSDGLHFTPKGYGVVHEAIISIIKDKIPELYFENLKETFPLWRDIDYENPEKSLQLGQN